MENTEFNILKYISIIQRNTHRFFDLELSASHIGFGQQFFLVHISEHPGITMYGLSLSGHFDKGTVTKAVQKLAEEGYIRIEPDTQDKRIRHLFVTPEGEPVVERINLLKGHWKYTLTSEISEEQLLLLENSLKSMAQKTCGQI